MPLFLPVPSALPNDDIAQYVPLLLSAVEGFLQLKDVWSEADYVDGFQYMEALKQWIVENIPMANPIPIGMIAPFGQANTLLPDKWLWCNGAAVSRTTYADLFAVVGIGYGAGDGSTTFNIPDLRERFLYGAQSQMTGLVGAHGGEQSHTLTTAEMPSHSHLQQGFVAGGTAPVKNIVANRTGAIQAGNPSDVTGGDGAHNNMPPYMLFWFGVYAGV